MARKKGSGALKKIGYEFLEHTADVKFRAYGKNFEEAISNAGKATIAVMTDISAIRQKKTKEIKIESKTKESLVYDFLEKLVFLIDTEGFLMKEVKRINVKKRNGLLSLNAVLKGDNARNYDVHTYIKAVTYSDMLIDEEKKGCAIQVVHDI